MSTSNYYSVCSRSFCNVNFIQTCCLNFLSTYRKEMRSAYSTMLPSQWQLECVWWSIKIRYVGTIWKLCEPKQRESGNRTALCPSTGRGFRGVTPEKFLQLMGKSAFWAISWPKWLAKLHAIVDMRLGKIFSIYIHVWCMVWYSLIIISSIGLWR